MMRNGMRRFLPLEEVKTMISKGISKRALCAALCGGAIGCLVGFPQDALAWWVRQHAGDCLGADTVATTGFGVGGSFKGYYCPVPDNSTTPKTAIVTTNVELRATTSGVWNARACYADWNGTIGACDNFQFAPSGTGHKTISLGAGNGFFDTDGGQDFAFVFVGTGNETPTGGRLAGIYYSN